jgi:membrane fusion protein (multidrug efflux system)
VQVIEVIQKDVAGAAGMVGTLDGMVNAQINAQVAGYLVSRITRKVPGQKGQLMYEIDPRTFKASLMKRGNLARQAVKTAQLNLARIKRLLPGKPCP